MVLKPQQNNKGRKKFWDASKLVVLLYSWQLRRRLPFLVHPKQMLGPSYLVSALVYLGNPHLKLKEVQYLMK
jgi:hypothetical protein